MFRTCGLVWRSKVTKHRQTVATKDQALVLSALSISFRSCGLGLWAYASGRRTLYTLVALALAHKIMLYGFTSMPLAYDFRRTLIVPIVVFTDNE